jgi:DNA-binding NtrC family response regulator
MERKVLVIGKNPGAREELQMLTHAFGLDAEVSDASEYSLLTIPYDRYTTVIVDLDMTSGDPVKTISILHKNLPKVPIIGVTNQKPFSQEKRIRTAGVFYYLVRPLDGEEFFNALGDAVAYAAMLNGSFVVPETERWH